ncbi:MAG TPA: DUF962 domain-containing protein [Pyrinomonadaceae bacterium]
MTSLMADSFIDNYKARHQHPVNKLCHVIGIPMITLSLPLFFFNWRWALGLFVAGWMLQFIGHAVEGNHPAFFKNPIYFAIGRWWFVRRVAEAVGLLKPSTSK